MRANLKTYIARSADTTVAESRLHYLVENTDFESILGRMPETVAETLVSLISFSDFFFRFICRNPNVLLDIREPFSRNTLRSNSFSSLAELKKFKYQQLLKITLMDYSSTFDYTEILNCLSILADYLVGEAQVLITKKKDLDFINKHLAAFALGKLGASELNFSSDIDLIFVCSNTSDIDIDVSEYQKILQDSIRLLTNQLENRDADGFLYRVDLKLRPWGKSGPLVMTVDETENYYEASSEAWERFAWLRARAILGSKLLSDDVKNRLHPFVYRRSLSSDDLDRFLEIKHQMGMVRRKKGYWNVKVGEGGIRDLEFFIQMLQMVNAYSYPGLQIPGTLNVLSELNKFKFISDTEAAEICHSYLFLRRLENHLQMVDEQQTHELPDEWQKRIVIARSLGIAGNSDNEILDKFETELFANQSIAQSYFERLLPEQ